MFRLILGSLTWVLLLDSPNKQPCDVLFKCSDSHLHSVCFMSEKLGALMHVWLPSESCNLPVMTIQSKISHSTNAATIRQLSGVLLMQVMKTLTQCSLQQGWPFFICNRSSRSVVWDHISERIAWDATVTSNKIVAGMMWDATVTPGRH
jgi:hypothetical protein